MNCQKCGTPLTAGKPFCDVCGAPANAQAAPASDTTRPNSNTMILVVVGVFIVLGLFVMVLAAGSGTTGGGGMLATPQPPVPTVTPAPAKKAGYDKPEHALEAKMPANWVYKLNTSTTTRREFWAGPPASEYVSVYVVAQNADGSWSVASESPMPEIADPVAPPAQSSSDVAVDEAVAVVEDFLGYIRADQPMSAHALCIEPFASDGASAGYSNGEFNSWTVEETDLDTDDMSVWVDVIEYWDSGPMRMGYHAEPTQNGYRISKAELW